MAVQWLLVLLNFKLGCAWTWMLFCFRSTGRSATSCRTRL